MRAAVLLAACLAAASSPARAQTLPEGDCAGVYWDLTARFDAGDVTLRSLLALIYLVIFGSLIAYSAYVWLLTVSTPARVGTYAYVNPVIALLLGWALAGEAIGLRSGLAAAVIVGSVFVIVSERSAHRGGRARPAAEAARRSDGEGRA